MPLPSTSTERGSTSRRRRTSFEVSGITALPHTDDEDDQLLARPRKKTRSLPSPVQDDDEWSQDNVTSIRTAKKNKRPLNGPSLTKNRRQVLNVEDDDEAEIFITQTTPPKKKNKKKRRRSPSPNPPPTSTNTTNDNEKLPEPEDAETTSKKKHKKKKKNKDKPHHALAKLISDQDEVLRQLAKGNRK